MSLTGQRVYFIFIILIIIAILFKRKPVLFGALGLLVVGVVESGGIFQGIQTGFRGLLLTAADLLPVILLIGLVVSMTTMLKDTGTDQILIRPFLRIRRNNILFWVAGLALWLLTLFLWPTPALMLLGTVVLPLIGHSGIQPLGLAVGLCIFGEGLGLSGDFIIQGAPGLVAKSAGIELGLVLAKSAPLVFGSGLLAALFGFWQFVRINKYHAGDSSNNGYEKENKDKGEHSNRKGTMLLALFTAFVYLSGIVWLLYGGIRGDGAAAATGGITILVLITGSIFKDYKTALNSFFIYIQTGMKFSMEVFGPIVVIGGFFLLGTQSGNAGILLKSGPGYLQQFALALAQVTVLNELTCTLIIISAAILGAMSGSGFAALPLVGGLAAALSQASGLSAVHLAVLGQAVAIWTDALLIPWGFPAVVGAVTKTDPQQLAGKNLIPWLAVVVYSLIWALFML